MLLACRLHQPFLASDSITPHTQNIKQSYHLDTATVTIRVESRSVIFFPFSYFFSSQVSKTRESSERRANLVAVNYNFCAQCKNRVILSLSLKTRKLINANQLKVTKRFLSCDNIAPECCGLLFVRICVYASPHMLNDCLRTV